MIREAIDKIQSLTNEAGGFIAQELNGHQYTKASLTRIRESKETAPASLTVGSLSGLVDLYHEGIGEYNGKIFHVVSPTRVDLIGQIQPDNFNERWTYGSARLDLDGFSFNRWYDGEAFIVGLMSGFVQTDMLSNIIKWAGNVAAEASVRNEDDGISQSVSIKTGITTNERVTIENPIDLKPYRTFREVDQPAGNFIFRLKNKDKEFGFALFTGDGECWQLEAIANIKTWIEANAKDAVVIA